MDEVRYQVFVSSTFRDLKEEREKVLQAILEMKAFPAGMELFPSADDEQFEFIKREIDSSDYYTVIIAGRYGSLAPDGMSFTEKEYDYAVMKGKPVLVFVHHDMQQIIGERLEPTDEGKARLSAFRTKAMGGRLVSSYRSPDDLKAKVLTSLMSQFNIKPRRGWVRSGQTPREDLERINALQQRVIDLETENAKLRELNSDAVNQLASGTEPVNWKLDLNTFAFNNSWPKVRELTLETTWDEMLLTAFPNGVSHLMAIDAEKSIAELILAKLDPKREETALREQAAGYLKRDTYHFPAFPPVKLILGDMQRQFSGLRLIEEGMETIYVPQQYGAAPTPRTMSTWRLTAKGQTYIALIGGYTHRSS